MSAVPFVPWACSETLSQQLPMCRHWLNIFVPSAYVELDGVVVEDLAVLLARAHLAAAHALGAHRVHRRLSQLPTSRLWMCCSTM